MVSSGGAAATHRNIERIVNFCSKDVGERNPQRSMTTVAGRSWVTVLETTACDQYREILGGVAAPVSQIAAPTRLMVVMAV